ncbi:DsbA family protein (plasmid) [Sinorhizobium meliloti]|uniref:DsbA family protein n=1 Tax=Rhizobium meliloti TaxID=382 RepID=UPI00299E422D|nr:thioredoxin domain-containing protein [Sinorhizobium meliloti]MDW9998154.1 thioredoxin domain-containing protein [Sinorhizobium meliloti]
MIAKQSGNSASSSSGSTAATGGWVGLLKPLVFASFVLAGLSVVLSALALLYAAGILGPQRDSPDIESRLHAYLLANPEVLIESVNGLQARRQAAENSELTAVISQRHDEIFNDPGSPVGANPKGDAVLVEFFDYNCPYCRQATPMLDSLEQEDKGLRLVFKEYPILGAGSVFAARAALASQKQGKYLAFHKAMMAYQGRITEESSLEVAANVGLDVERLKQDMTDPAIEEIIKRNVALAQALRISGTPSFVVGKEIVRGLTDASSLKRLIASARGS